MKFIVKITLYQLIYYAVRLTRAGRRDKQLLLIKTDEIGDYILIRNLLPLFKQTGPYRQHKITLVGNAAWRSIFNRYDTAAVDEVIWMDKKRYKQDLRYRFGFLRHIRKLGFSEAISLIYARSYRLEDMIMGVCGAPVRIGMRFDDVCLGSYERWLTPRHLYTRLEDSGENTLFDAIRNARFIGRVLGLPAPLPSIALEAPPAGSLPFTLPPAYFVVFPGASQPERLWPPAWFATVAHHLADRYGLLPVVCGAPADAADCAAFIRAYEGSLLDLTGKTDLVQMLTVLKNAACLITVDTGSVHLAAAVQCPVFGIFNGRYYGRFAPYPPEIAPRMHPVYPDEIDEMLQKNIPFVTDLIAVDLVKKVTPEKLIAVIDKYYPVPEKV